MLSTTSSAVRVQRSSGDRDGTHLVSLDEVIDTMRTTGLDMSHKDTETAVGGLAVNVSVNSIEC